VATSNSTAAPERVDHIPTAPLPKPAADALHRLELALTTPAPTVVSKVRAALGFGPHWQPDSYLGETATRLTTWSQMELNDLYERVGGTVTTRPVKRTSSDGTTWAATEITVTVQVEGVGPVEISTDIEDDPEHGYRTDVPVVVVARAVTRFEIASARYDELIARPASILSPAEFDAVGEAQQTIAEAFAVLADHGRADLVRGL
jgi:hypothetical protein